MINYCLDIVWRAADEKWLQAACQNIINRSDSIALKLCNSVDLVQVCYIEQMMWNECSFFGGHFGGTDVEATIDLARVGRDDFTVETLRQDNAQATLSRRCGAEDDN